ncbi:lectin-like protein [Pyxidicoccus sp. 3LFB2]
MRSNGNKAVRGSRLKSGVALLFGMAALSGCGTEAFSADGPLTSGPEVSGTARQGLSYYGGHTYFISTTTTTWADAQKTCADLGYGMVTLNDAAEEQWLKAQLPTPTTEWWLGINDRGTEGVWEWSDDVSTYLHWNPGEPNNSQGAEDCGLFLNALGGWHDAPCSLSRTFVCESVPRTVAQFNGHDYVFFGVRKPWAQAREACTSQGFDLVTIDDSAEDTWLKQQVPAGRASFIGYNDLAQEGTWAWASGTPSGYVNWRHYEPNNSQGSEHCAVNNAPPVGSIPAGGWNDIPCDVYFPYVCERPSLPANYKYVVYTATGTYSATQGTKDTAIYLQAGQILEMGTCGLPTAVATNDTYLRLLGPDWQEVAANDDDCKGLGSKLRYRVPACGTGNYVMRAGCSENTSCGGQMVFTVIPAPAPQP